MEINSLSLESIAKLKEVVRRVLGEAIADGTIPTQPQRRTGLPIYIAKNGASTIAARSGTTVSSGTVTLQDISAGGTTLANLTDSDGNDVTETAWNLSETEVGANEYLMLAQDLLTGKLWVFWEDC